MIHGKLFEPETLTVLVGESVSWTNHDSVHHDVEADDGSFDSGDLEPGGTFSATFARPGRVTYLCTIHRFMRGEVEVFALSLAGPDHPVPVGGRAVLRGLAPPESELVTIQRREPDGRWTPVSTAAPSGDGTYRVELVTDAPVVVRAVAGPLESRPVRITVSARLHVSARTRRGQVVIVVSAAPAQPRAPVALQLYARERFVWVSVARIRLDLRSRAGFTLDLGRPRHVRAVLLAGVGGYGPATSRAAVVRP
jgi:hypothetical protein